MKTPQPMHVPVWVFLVVAVVCIVAFNFSELEILHSEFKKNAKILVDATR